MSKVKDHNTRKKERENKQFTQVVKKSRSHHMILVLVNGTMNGIPKEDTVRDKMEEKQKMDIWRLLILF